MGYIPHNYEAAAARLRAAEKQAAREEAARAEEQAKADAVARALADLAAKRQAEEASRYDGASRQVKRRAARKNKALDFLKLTIAGAEAEYDTLLARTETRQFRDYVDYLCTLSTLLRRGQLFIPNKRVERQVEFIDKRHGNLKSWSTRLVNSHMEKIRTVAKQIWRNLPKDERAAVRKIILDQERWGRAAKKRLQYRLTEAFVERLRRNITDVYDEDHVPPNAKFHSKIRIGGDCFTLVAF